MEQKTETGNQSSASSNGQDPLEDLQDQLSDLNTSIEKLMDEISDKEASLEQATDEIEAARNVQRTLAARRTSLSRLVDSYQSDKQKIDQQRESAGNEVDRARQALSKIRKSLEEQIPEQRRNALDQAMSEIDGHIRELAELLAQRQEQAGQAEGELTKAKAVLAHAESLLQQSQNDLKQLPGTIQSLSAQVKSKLTALQKASDSGQSVEAFLLAGELELALQNLDRYLDPELQRSLARKLDDAWSSLRSAGESVVSAEEDVKQARKEEEKVKAELNDFTDNRRSKIEAKIPETQDEPEGDSEQGKSGVEQE